MPEEAFAAWFGATIGGLWLTLLATTVIEACSEGSTPIAAGLSPGPAVAPGQLKRAGPFHWHPLWVKMRAFSPDRSTPMLEINPLIQTLKDIDARTDVLRGYL